MIMQTMIMLIILMMIPKKKVPQLSKPFKIRTMEVKSRPMNQNQLLLLKLREKALERISKLRKIYIMNHNVLLSFLTIMFYEINLFSKVLAVQKHMCSTRHTHTFKVLYTIYPLYVINEQVDKTNFVPQFKFI